MSPSDAAAIVSALLLVATAAVLAAASRVVRVDGFIASVIAIAVTLVAAGAISLAAVGQDLFGGAVRRDTAALFFGVLLALSTAGALIDRARHTTANAIALLLVSCAGGLLTAASGDLVVLVVGLALLTLPLAIAGRKNRAALVLVGALGIAAVGCADVALATGSSSLAALDVATPLAAAGVALILAGLAVIAGVVPLRSDPATRDAYEILVLRVAGFAALLRVGAALAPSALLDWRTSLALIAAVNVIVASLIAIGQTAIARIFAFASVAQAGYVTIALTAGFASGPAAAFYLIALAVMTFGALALTSALPPGTRLRDLRGLARRRPLFTTALGAVLLGLAGLPPSLGFVAKLYVLELAVGAQLAWLAVIAALASVLSAVAYLRILFACLGEGQGVPLRPRSAVIGYVAAVVVIFAGLIPGPLLNVVQNVRF